MDSETKTKFDKVIKELKDKLNIPETQRISFIDSFEYTMICNEALDGLYFDFYDWEC